MSSFKQLSLFLAMGTALLSQEANAQTISAPGWNAEPMKSGGTLFRHESGNGSLMLSRVDFPENYEPKGMLVSLLDEVARVSKCPGYRDANLVPFDRHGNWQIKSFGQGVTCSVIVKPINAKSAYLIVFNDKQNGVTGAEAFAQKIASGLSRLTAPITSIASPERPSVKTAFPNSADIVGVIFDNTQSKTTYNMSSLGAASQFTEFFVTSEVLFANGVACRDCLEDWVADASLAKYRQENPDDMGSWNKNTNGYSIRYPDESEARKVETSALVRPAPPGKTFDNLILESVDGRSSGVGDSFSMTVQSDKLLLSKDGRFLSGSQFQGYSERVVSSELGSVGPIKKGRYSVDGYTIRFDHDDGKIETVSLLTFPAEPDFLIIDGSAFITFKQD